MQARALEALTDDMEVRLRRKVEIDSGFVDTGRQVQKLKLHFKKFDSDNSGEISFAEFEAALAAKGFVGVQGPVAALFDRYDADDSGSLDYHEFASLVLGKKANPNATSETRSAMERVKNAIAARGGLNGVRSVKRVFTKMDGNRGRSLDFGELRDGLRDMGVELSDHDFRTVCRIFDVNGDGVVTFEEFLRGLRGGLPKQRMKLIKEAFRRLDKTGDGVVTIEDLRDTYDARWHPDVRRERATEEEVLAEFLSAFDSKSGSGRDGVVTSDEFVEYYRDVSASIDDDEYFEVMMRNAWHISGGTGAAENTSNIRVLVQHSDGETEVVGLEDDLGVRRNDLVEIRRRLEKQGVKDIIRISLAH